MSAIISPIFFLIILALLLLIVMALLSPFEALGWWAGWTRRDLRPLGQLPLPAGTETDIDFYLVYLTAIGGISAETISKRERNFLEKLEAAMPGNVEIISDVFPFSVTNNPLNGERSWSWLWQRIHNSRLGRRGSMLATLIFIRNLLQVGVSSDARYGPIYNVGVARELVRSLLRHGYPPDSGIPIAVMGWSGGGQIAVGVAPFLHEALQAPVYVVSIGGVISDDPGMHSVEKLIHLQGSRDSYPRIGEVLFPGRWAPLRHSAWNQAWHAGRIVNIDPGPMKHTGSGDYFDYHTLLPNGQTYAERTADVVAAALVDEEIPPLTAVAPASN